MEDTDYAPPKYIQIVQTIRRRIKDGTYPPGSMLPSETRLIQEFGVSRPTVVKALDTLKLRGEIDREHGRGSFVKASAGSAEDHQRPTRAVLDEPVSGALLTLDRRPAPASVAALLEVPQNFPVLLRQHLAFQDDAPFELVSYWVLPHIAEAAGLDQDTPSSAGVRQRLQSAANVRLGRVTERLTARRPTGEEANALSLGKTAPVLGVTAAVYEVTGRPVLVVELVLPGELHELEDEYTL
ncbi:GntR family transcriptional regulator [Actinoallomurus sp. NPDC052308]|uniref:GntR family transcriptional regulator n=1 Tax=Actinoallomurus sp. NPDC052308 TaxID=3155530 RepID=UPI0034181A88